MRQYVKFLVFFISTIAFNCHHEGHASNFTIGDLFIASSVTDEVRYYDSATLAFKGAFTHDLFNYEAERPNEYRYGPNGMAFNHRGHLVVAAYDYFVEFSEPGVEYARYPKAFTESNENIIFDNHGNMYTTTSTNGSNRLNQYHGADYSFWKTLSLPAGSGELSGITFDDDLRFYIMSQNDRNIHVMATNNNYSVFSHTDSFGVGDVNGLLEDLQINQDGELLAAIGDVVKYNPDTGNILGSFDVTPDTDEVPVSITVD